MSKKLRIFRLLWLCCLPLWIGSFPLYGNNSLEWQEKSYMPDLYLLPAYTFETKVIKEQKQDLSLEISSCASPADYGTKDIKHNEVTIYWEDTVNTAWEYYVVPAGDPVPAASGTSTSTKENTITQDSNGNPLLPNKEYEYYVRSICENGGVGNLEGFFEFKTACAPFAVFFSEGFNSSSVSIDCWTVVDNNKDVTSSLDNIWKNTKNPGDFFEGDGAMFFDGTGGKVHDDWLISPKINLTGGIYAVSFYYKTSYTLSHENKFEVLLSQNGADISDFTTVLLPAQKYNQGEYKKETIYVKDISGGVHLAWHVVSDDIAKIYIDLVTIEEVDCLGPAGVEIYSLGSDRAIFDWQDDENSQWEFNVKQADGVPPVGSGSISNSTSATVTRESGSGVALQPDTAYEFYVRSICGGGKNSNWVGPYNFRTLCVKQNLPYHQGFNTSSTGITCWQTIDENEDMWTIDTFPMSWTYSDDSYEGDRSVIYRGAAGTSHDNMLISPVVSLDPSKVYKLKYAYKVERYLSGDNIFEVKVSNQGIANKSYFDIILKKAKVYTNEDWIEETLYLRNIGGDVNIAWHVLSTDETKIFLDNVVIEEAIGHCFEPSNLDVDKLEADKVTIVWDNVFDYTEWEYILQDYGKGIPTLSDIGITAYANENEVDKTLLGVSLERNKKYEFYVRTVCVGGKSVWSGPYVFELTCAPYTVPFWEGFNTNSNSADCWRVIDVKNDYDIGGAYKWLIGGSTHTYEGNRAAYFFGLFGSGFIEPEEGVIHDDWLISPEILLDDSKIYELRYHFRDSDGKATCEFEVLASNTGGSIVDFDTVIVPRKEYPYNGGNYREKRVYLQNLGGNVRFAWHVTAKGQTELTIDNVFIEEVACPQPQDLSVSAIDTTGVTVFWKDDFGSLEWEYYVQEVGKGAPESSGQVTEYKENLVTTDNDGNRLKPSTKYEYYVRTVCDGGSYSEWSGPHVFVTACDVFIPPFWEGFNTESNSINCWEIIDGDNNGQKFEFQTGSGMCEGDGTVFLQSVSMGTIVENDDWLISPDFKLDGGMYMLKYTYTAAELPVPGFIFMNDFQVVMSKDDFKNDIVTVDFPKGESGECKERVIFIDGVNDTVKFAWHVENLVELNEMSMVATMLMFDNISIKKIETCAEPYAVEVIDQDSNSISLAWEQYGTVSGWELIVVEYGKGPNGTPIQTVNVTGNPEVTITGLDKGEVYSFYVRAICEDDITYSEWSSVVDGATDVGENDNCDGAIDVPINKGIGCEKIVSGSFIGATLSDVPLSSCAQRYAPYMADVWHEFTATSTTHIIKITSQASFMADLYMQNCDQITSSNAVKECFSFYGEHLLDNLVVGQKYYIRMLLRLPGFGSTEEEQRALKNSLYTLCISSANSSPSTISLPSEKGLSIEELVKDVMVDASCEQISDVRVQAGNDSGVNVFGYFNFNDERGQFPFEEGVVLATHDVNYVPGPYTGGLGGGVPTISAYDDEDLNELLEEVGAAGYSEYFPSILEFDFVSLKDSLSFEYLYAHHCYNCKIGSCSIDSVVAAWLIDEEENRKENIALVPGTNDVISPATIRDYRSKSESRCMPINGEYFYGTTISSAMMYNYDPDLHVHPFEWPINYQGSTVAMKTKEVKIVPGRKYRMKIVVAEGYSVHGSAIFINAKSFDLGNLEGMVNLGEDLLLDNRNALCEGTSVMLDSKLRVFEELNMEIEWYKDNKLLEGEVEPKLLVSDPGMYKIKVQLPDLDCEFSDSVVVEVYPPVSQDVRKPEKIVICQSALEDISIDLQQVEAGMFIESGKDIYTTSYYLTEEEAMSNENSIQTPSDYNLGKAPESHTLYIRVDNTETGCHEVFELHIQSQEGEIPEKPESVTVCAEYVFPELENNQYYYSEPEAGGVEYKAEEVLDIPGEHTIYVLQLNDEDGCYEETSYKVNITEAVVADVFEDVEIECELYELQSLSKYNRYFTEPNGGGTELYAGMEIPLAQTIYVYAESEDGLCVDESSFTVTYNDCPIPRGISPNGDGFNDTFDLSRHGVESIKIYNRWGTEVYSHGLGYTDQWYGQNKSGKQLPDGTYYYVIIAHGKTRTGWVQINR